MNFYIKLHPIEDEHEYKQHFKEGTIIPNGYPIELFFGRNCVAGGASSSSLYNAVLQGYTAIDITKILDCSGNRASSLIPWCPIKEVDSLDELYKFLKEKNEYTNHNSVRF